MMTRYVYRHPLQLDALGLDMPVLAEAHPNRAPFSGILTRLDEPSTRPPNGSDGHLVCIPSAVAEAALPTLIGMGVDVDAGFRDHNKKVKVGVLTSGERRGQDLVVQGHIFARDFPEEFAYIQAHKPQLGMSYEIADVEVEDTRAPVWVLRHLTFTGAAILAKRAAAYQDTSIAASQNVLSADDLLTLPQFCEELRDYLATAYAVVAVHVAQQQRRAHDHNHR
jgi:hypothetical protein